MQIKYEKQFGKMHGAMRIGYEKSSRQKDGMLIHNKYEKVVTERMAWCYTYMI